MQKFLVLAGLFACFISSGQNTDSLVYIKKDRFHTTAICLDKSTGKSKPIREAGEHIFQIQYVYDKHGNITEERYFDSLSKPVLCDEGYTAMLTRYKKDGLSYEQYYKDLAGQDAKNGFFTYYAKQKWCYRTGSIKKNDTIPINFWESTFDTKTGKYTSELFYSFEKKTGHDQGFAYCGYITTLDKHHRPICTRYIDSLGQPANNNQGIASINYLYENGNLARIEWRDKDSALTSSGIYDTDFSIVHFSYNPKGLLSEINCTRPNGKPGWGSPHEFAVLAGCKKPLWGEKYTPRIKLYYKGRRVIKVEYYEYDSLKRTVVY